MKKILLLITITLFSCGSTAQKSKKAPQEIAAVYYQHWVGGQELSGSGTDFYIEFKAPLAKEIMLVKIFFQNRAAKLEKVTETKYIGHFFQRPELVVDEMGNQTIVHKAPDMVVNNYKLGEKDAMLEFIKNKKNGTFRFNNVEEKELLAYPSAPPMNRN
jgi:hypothetical protein